MKANSCPEPDALAAYADGSLLNEMAATLEQHFLECAACTRQLDEYDAKHGGVLGILRDLEVAAGAADADPSDSAVDTSEARGVRTLLPGVAVETGNSGRAPAFRAVPGAMLGAYRLERKLGEGGMGAVWRAFHTRLEKAVAIKLLSPQLTRNAAHVARFEREMKAVGRLKHPHIVAAHDAGEASGVHYLVMEYTEGRDLARLVKTDGPQTVRAACDMIRQAALGLAHAHQHGIVHRDIKPSNLFLADDGTVKLLDLGLARLQDVGPVPDAHLATSVFQVMGTPDFIAPEQWEDTHAVDHRADLYALGCTLFYLLVGRAPFAEHGTCVRKLAAHLFKAPPDLRQARPEVPESVAAIYRRLMSKSPEGRFSSADELAAALAGAGSDSAPPPVPAQAEGPRDEEETTAAPTYAEIQADASNSPSSVIPSRAGFLKDQSSAAVPASTAQTLAAASGRVPAWRNRRFQATGFLAALLLLIALVLKVQTPAGTVIIEVDQPEIAGAEVFVDNEKKITIRPGKDQEEIRIEPDEKRHLLKVSKAGFVTFTREFTVAGGKPETIRVTLAPEGVSPEKAPPEVTVAEAANAAPPGQEELAGWHGWPADAPSPAIAPFDAAAAAKHQLEWATYLKVPVEYENSLGMKFRLIPPGEFVMGSSEKEIESHLPDHDVGKEVARSEGPEHRVTLTRPLYLCIHEVTQSQFTATMGFNPSGHQKEGPLGDKLAGVDTAAFPVESVGFLQVAEFCARLSQKEKLHPFYLRYVNRGGNRVRFLDGAGYRLATDAEWEFAARAGTTSRTWLGPLAADAEWDVVSRAEWLFCGTPKPVGTKKANPFGLFDMLGNVCEICQDVWTKDYYSELAEKGVADPIGKSLDGPRAPRGGCYTTKVPAASWRMGDGILGQPHIGFRIALEVEAVRHAMRSRGPSIPPRKRIGWMAEVPLPAVAPFSADAALKHQMAWASYLGVPAEYTNTIGMRFRLIPPGEYDRGTSAERLERILKLNHGQNEVYLRSEAPLHRVVITQPMYVGVHEVTQQQYETIMGTNPAKFRKGGAPEFAEAVGDRSTANYPVENLRGQDPFEFCTRLGEKEGVDLPIEKPEAKPWWGSRFPEERSYRLPTEGEWEYFCRAGTTTDWWYGDDPNAPSVEVMWQTLRQPHPVGETGANPFQLCDTSGNVREFVLDEYLNDSYSRYRDWPAIDPVYSRFKAAGCVRGGGFGEGAYGTRSAFRTLEGGERTGFRVVLVLGARDILKP